MKTFAVGDIHGQLRLLQALMEVLKGRAEPGDTLVFVGDYIDRGPDSRGVVDLVLELRDGGWNGPVVTLKGNHEAMLLGEEQDPRPYEPGLWLWNGGEETVKSYAPADFRKWWRSGGLGFLPEAHLEFFRGLRLWYEDEHALYVHAGFAPGIEPEDQVEETMLWIRGDFIESEYAWRKPVVFGHTPMSPNRHRDLPPEEIIWAPLCEPARIGIDTGAAYGGPLTAVELPERLFYSVSHRAESNGS